MDLKSLLSQKLHRATLNGELSSNELAKIMEDVEHVAVEEGYSKQEVYDAFKSNTSALQKFANTQSLLLLEQFLSELNVALRPSDTYTLSDGTTLAELVTTMREVDDESITTLLYDAYEDMESRFSSAEAKAYLSYIISSSPDVVSRLDLGARELFGDLIHQTNGHLRKMEEIWVAQTGHEGLIDVDLNGVITSEDLALYIEKGEVKTESIGEPRLEALKLAKAVADAAETMGGSDVSFIDIELIKRREHLPEIWTYRKIGRVRTEDGWHRVYSRQTFNRDFWDVKDSHIGRVRDGVRPSDAIDDIVINGGEYKYECATAMMAVYYLALKNHMGADRFDAEFQNLVLAEWRRPAEVTTERFDERPSAPGSYGYIENDATAEGDALGWTGENVIYIGLSDQGEPLYYGHPFGISTADEIIDELYHYSKPNADRPDFLEFHSKLSGSVIQ